MIRGYVWKRRKPGVSKPWVVAFVEPERPGVEVWQGRDFRRWKAAMNWADKVARQVNGKEQG